jgi:hypothetical protein
MSSKPVGVGANVAKFCRDTARNSVLDTNNKAQGVLRSVAEWHEKKIETIIRLCPHICMLTI